MTISRISDIIVGGFHISFGQMKSEQTKILYERLVNIAGVNSGKLWPIGEFIYFLHENHIPFAMTYRKPNNITEEMAMKQYANEFLPLYMMCINTGVIERPKYD